MGTLPPALFNSGIERLPFPRITELTIKSPVVAGNDLIISENQIASGQTTYGPCPLSGLPVFADDDKIPDPLWGEVWDMDNTLFSEIVRTPPWDGPRRITYWDEVTYDYSRSVDGNSLAGSGPSVNLQTGSIIVSAPENRPLPYVTWLGLRATPVVTYEIVEQSISEEGFGFWTEESTSGGNYLLNNFNGVDVGIVRHEIQSDLANYKLVAVEENALSFNGLSEGIANTPLGSGTSCFIWGFDVVPPNKTFHIYAGWASGNINDWAIQAYSRTMVAAKLFDGPPFLPSSSWTQTPPTANNDPSDTTYFPSNRFGVMTF